MTQVTTVVKTTSYQLLKQAHDDSVARTREVLNAHPMLYAISREGKSGVTGEFAQQKDPAQARAQLGAAMRKLISDIEATQDRLKAESFVLDLIPLQEQLFAGKKSRHPQVDWSQQMPQEVAKEVKADHDFANALAAMGLQIVSAAAFMLAPLTSGASLAALMAVGVTAAGVKAYQSSDQYDALLQASKTAATPGSELVSDAQVDNAKTVAEADRAALALAVVNAAALGGMATLRYAAQAIAAAKDKPVVISTHWIGTNDEDLQRSAGWLKPEGGKWDVLIHGDPGSFSLYERTKGPGGFLVGPGSSEKWTPIQHRELARYMKTPAGTVSRSGSSRVNQRRTGQVVAKPSRRISNKLGVPVTAPTEKVWIYPDGSMVISNKRPPDSGEHVSTGQWVTFSPGGNVKR